MNEFPRRFGPYVLLKPLARGGMGAVSNAIAQSAAARGAVIRTGAGVKNIRVSNGRARGVELCRIERTTEGHIKIVTDKAGDILGTTIVGPDAAEAIAPWTLAVSQKLNIRAFASHVVPYPSYAEVGKRAAITYFTHGLTRPRTRRIMGWLRRTR